MNVVPTFKYGSVCSGIEAASVAWHQLGWKPAFLSEVEPFPRAVLTHHFPNVPLHGDFTTITEAEYDPIDLLVGGTPCQDFSVAGLRAGMAGDRGNLTLQFLSLANRLRPRWMVWENVPGVLSSNGGRDFGAFLGGLGELGYGWAYRTLDAQYFGVPQRRRRVFVVGYLGDWRHAAAVLFERHCLSGHHPPRREEGAGSPIGTFGGTSPGGGWRFGADEAAAGQLIAGTLRGSDGGADPETGRANHLIVHGTQDPDVSVGISHPIGRNQGQENVVCITGDVTHTLNADGFDASEDGTGRGQPIVSVGVALRGRDGGATAELTGELMTALRCGGGGGDKPHAMTKGTVRRLTPRECERLQGFPDDWTLVPYRGKPASDGPRYKAIGNSMAVPVMSWIGERIMITDQINN